MALYCPEMKFISNMTYLCPKFEKKQFNYKTI